LKKWIITNPVKIEREDSDENKSLWQYRFEPVGRVR
jgi:hypothetical protein